MWSLPAVFQGILTLKVDISALGFGLRCPSPQRSLSSPEPLFSLSRTHSSGLMGILSFPALPPRQSSHLFEEEIHLLPPLSPSQLSSSSRHNKFPPFLPCLSFSDHGCCVLWMGCSQPSLTQGPPWSRRCCLGDTNFGYKTNRWFLLCAHKTLLCCS